MTPGKALRGYRALSPGVRRTCKAADAWQLDLGDVRETARVSAQWQTARDCVEPALQGEPRRAQGTRQRMLEVEVTNWPRTGFATSTAQGAVEIMREINIVTVKYRPFDAAAWEVEPSGLLGPVALVPLSVVSPGQVDGRETCSSP
jgi:hypothetical protein